MQSVDVIVIGAGAAGLMCAIEAAKRGRKVFVFDHGKKLGGKILISGGGRCNFTNTGTTPAQYVSDNPHFCKSALSRYTPTDFTAIIEKHRIAYHEKKLGQLFCDHTAQNVVDCLSKELTAAGATCLMDTRIQSIKKEDTRFLIQTSRGEWKADRVVIATGGLSFPNLGATGFGYEIAKQFGIACTDLAPALDGFIFAGPEMRLLTGKQGPSLAGVAHEVSITTPNGLVFVENILFTHSGLSGPAALQASLHWHPGESIEINLAPKTDLGVWLIEKKKQGSRQLIKNVLSEQMPSRLAERFLEENPIELLQEWSDASLIALGKSLNAWTWTPARTVGYAKAEVTRGGVSTDELSSKTMESRKVPGLYFIGEVVDVTGWLGGYNFQWAWASGWAAGQSV